MSNELTVMVSLTFSKGGAEVTKSYSKTIDVTGDAFNHDVQSIGTSEEIIYQGTDLGTLGFVLLINHDTTNYVEAGITGQYSVKMEAGEPALFRADADIYARANTAACLVEAILVED